MLYHIHVLLHGFDHRFRLLIQLGKDRHQHELYTLLIHLQTCLILDGPTPEPIVTPPATGFEDVTNGYVPWSISNITPCAPSNNTRRPSSNASFQYY